MVATQSGCIFLIIEGGGSTHHMLNGCILAHVKPVFCFLKQYDDVEKEVALIFEKNMTQPVKMKMAARRELVFLTRFIRLNSS